MRVLIFTHEFAPFSGGISSYNQELAAGLAESGQEVLVLAPAYRSVHFDDARSSYRTLRYARARSIVSIPLSMRVFLRTTAAFQPDVVMLTDRFSHLAGALPCWLLSLSYVPVIHGTECVTHFATGGLHRELRAWYVRCLLRRASAVIAVSESTRAALEAAAKGTVRSVVTVHHGVALESLLGSGSVSQTDPLHRQLGCWPVILTVSRLVEGKGHDRVIEAVGSLRQRYPRAHYLIVGDGPYRQHLEAMVAALGLQDSVTFVGDVPRHLLGPYYRASDVFAMASRIPHESFGLVLVEAMLFGKPVVAGRVGGVPEVVIHGETGLLVDPNDAAEIAGAISVLIEDHGLANRLAEAARQRAFASFTRKAMVRKTLEVLRAAAQAVGESD